MGTYLSKGDTFNDGEQVTGARLNNLADNAVINPTAVTSQTQEVPDSSSFLLFVNAANGFRKCTPPQIGSALSFTLGNLPVIATNTVLLNNSGSTTNPQAFSIASSSIVGRDSTGSLGNHAFTDYAYNLGSVGSVQAFNVALGTNFNNHQDFRIGLTVGTPAPVANAKNATTIYFSPYIGNTISLYDGTNWNNYTSAELTFPLSATAASTTYDLFANYSGSISLSSKAWTNDITRNTSLLRNNGVWVIGSAAQYRYLGTFRTLVAGSTECSFGGTANTGSPALWLVVNENNKIPFTFQIVDSTSSWTDTTTAYKQLNASGSNRLTFCLAQTYDAVRAQVMYDFFHSAGGERSGCAIGVDSTSAVSGIGNVAQLASGNIVSAPAIYAGKPGAGTHFIQALQRGPSSGTTTFEGSSPGGFIVELNA